MRFQIRHVTTYRYDNPVILGPHLFRVHPREDGLVTLDSFQLAVHPPPLDLAPALDEEGNLTHQARFDGMTQEFRISVRCAGATHARLPSFVPSPVKVESYLTSIPEHKTVSDFAGEINGADALDFLHGLNRRIHEQVQTIHRLTGAPLEAEQTLRDGKGSCRDLAALFMACCRVRGIAARFVSGYFPAHPGDRQHMHAWAEAYVPLLGWLAFDPTQGGVVGERHIAVAAAALPSSATPISGFFIGQARSEMEIELSLDVVGD